MRSCRFARRCRGFLSPVLFFSSLRPRPELSGRAQCTSAATTRIRRRSPSINPRSAERSRSMTWTMPHGHSRLRSTTAGGSDGSSARGDGSAWSSEFIDLKVISETDRTYPISGAGAPNSPAPMNAIVQRYAMTHGLNFVLINVVSRTPLGEGPLTLSLRSGAGPTLPHAESTIDGEIREQDQDAGIGAQASAGLDLRVHAHVSVVMDYKFTVARPKIDVAQGTGRMTAATHQLAVGLAFGRPH